LRPLRRERALGVLEAAFAGLGLIDKPRWPGVEGRKEEGVGNVTRTCSRKVVNQVLDGLEERLANFKRDS
jgi:hypothetical protein